MKAMILAAGFGTRFRPITNTIPKALVPFKGSTLIEYNIQALKAQGITEIAINVHYLGAMIQQHLGDGSAYGVKIQYFIENPILNTGGAIQNALDFFDDTFIVVSCDVIANFNFNALMLTKPYLAHLFVVPQDNNNNLLDDADFSLQDNHLSFKQPRNYLYAGAGIFTKAMFDKTIQTIPLIDYLIPGITNNLIQGSIHQGYYFNVGTLEILEIAAKQV